MLYHSMLRRGTVLDEAEGVKQGNRSDERQCCTLRALYGSCSSFVSLGQLSGVPSQRTMKPECIAVHPVQARGVCSKEPDVERAWAPPPSRLVHTGQGCEQPFEIFQVREDVHAAVQCVTSRLPG